MSSPDRELKRQAIAALADEGIEAVEVPEGASPTPDLIARDSEGENYAVEIKSRPETWLDGAIPLSGENGEGWRREDSTGRMSALERVFEKAVRQLQSPVATGALRIAWFIADPTDWKYQYERIRATAYGLQIVVALGASPKEGYYTTYAAFARYQGGLDGVLLGEFDGLFVNDLSPNAARLRRSRLAAACEGSILDPAERASQGTCYRLVPGAWKPEREESMRRLSEAYGVRVVDLITLIRFAAVV